MNDQPFINALRAILGESPCYPAHKPLEPTQIALNALDEFEATLQSQRMLPPDGRPCAETWQARIEMRVEELRELITTGEIA